MRSLPAAEQERLAAIVDAALRVPSITAEVVERAGFDVTMRRVAGEVRRQRLEEAGVRPWTDPDDPIFETGVGDC
jgi:hypothetical protein